MTRTYGRYIYSQWDYRLTYDWGGTTLYTLRESNMAMENTKFIVDFPLENPISSGFLIATFYYRRVNAMKIMIETLNL